MANTTSSASQPGLAADLEQDLRQRRVDRLDRDQAVLERHLEARRPRRLRGTRREAAGQGRGEQRAGEPRGHRGGAVPLGSTGSPPRSVIIMGLLEQRKRARRGPGQRPRCACAESPAHVQPGVSGVPYHYARFSPHRGMSLELKRLDGRGR
jgi:hypothetical protein